MGAVLVALSTADCAFFARLPSTSALDRKMPEGAWSNVVVMPQALKAFTIEMLVVALRSELIILITATVCSLRPWFEILSLFLWNF